MFKSLGLMPLLILVSGYTCLSQSVTLPQTEFSIATDDSVSLRPGSTIKLPVWVLRSKSASRTKKIVHLNVSSTLPDGVGVTFQPEHGYFEYAEATISVSSEAVPGNFWLIISASAYNKTKGRIVKLSILEARDAAARAERQ